MFNVTLTRVVEDGDDGVGSENDAVYATVVHQGDEGGRPDPGHSTENTRGTPPCAVLLSGHETIRTGVRLVDCIRHNTSKLSAETKMDTFVQGSTR